MNWPSFLKKQKATNSIPWRRRAFKGDILRDFVWRSRNIKHLGDTLTQGGYPTLDPQNGLPKWLIFLGAKTEIVLLNGY